MPLAHSPHVSTRRVDFPCACKRCDDYGKERTRDRRPGASAWSKENSQSYAAPRCRLTPASRAGLALLSQRTEQTAKEADDLSTRIVTLEHTRWPLPAVAAVTAVGALAVAVWQAWAARPRVDGIRAGRPARACRWCSRSSPAAMLAAGTSPRATMSGTSLSGTHSRREDSKSSSGWPMYVALVGPVEVVPGVGEPVGGLDGHQVVQGPGPPAGLLLHLAGGRGRDVLAVLDDARREFPAPAVGDEAVPPQQQHLVGLVDDGGDGDRPQPYEEVVQVPAVGQLDIGQIDAEPAVFIHSLFVQFRPLHCSATFRRVDGNISRDMRARARSERNAQCPVDEFGGLVRVRAAAASPGVRAPPAAGPAAAATPSPGPAPPSRTAVTAARSASPCRSSIWLSMASRCTRPRSCAGVSTAAAACSLAAGRSPRLSRASATWTLTSPGWT